ncbi:MAG TPA: OmpA family protein [Tepidisphaeraceae bacterium]|jgi:chemotaxis protein MotB
MCTLPFLAAGVVGCKNAVHDENIGLRKQNIELQQEKSRLEGELGGRPQRQDVQMLQAQLGERDKQIADLQGQLNKPQPTASPEDNSALAGITVTRDDKAGTITVNVPGDVLFASGDSAVKESAKATLTKIADIVKKDFAGKKVMVDGHTDADPITRTKDKWKDNLDLSAARARSVADYLVSHGLEKKQVGLRAFGETDPAANKAKSRRVEIVVVTR